jgi:hypothetical protein
MQHKFYYKNGTWYCKVDPFHVQGSGATPKEAFDLFKSMVCRLYVPTQA